MTTDRKDDPVTYFMLVTDGKYAIGDRITDISYAEVNPRTIQISEVHGTDTPLDLVTRSRLARITGNDDGYTVEGIDPVDAMLGPQAREIIAAITAADGTLTRACPVSARYNTAVAAQYHGYTWLAEPHADAARTALERVGADDFFWFEVGGCAYGDELLALAARDLFGTVPGWDEGAYYVLTEPWRVAFGRSVHPADRIPAMT